MRQEVKKAVRTRADEYAKADPSKKGIIGLQGYLAYGSVDEPIEHQIAQSIEYFTKVRSDQRRLRDEIDYLKKKDE